jgi:hypothetical protein
MAPTPSTSERLQVMQAVEEGWQAFCRAPWPFVLFTLLTGALNVGIQALSNLSNLLLTVALNVGFQGLGNLNGLPEANQPPLAVLVITGIVGTVGQVVVSLWGSIGLIRGAWTALEGGRPGWSTFSRWDGSAAGRLFLRVLLFYVLLLVVLLVGVPLTVGLGQLQPLLGAIPALTIVVVLLYLSVGQSFLAWVALLEGRGPVATLQRGREVVDPQWWSVALLGLMLSAIMLSGVLLCCVGQLAAAPIALCVATAAYRQLFGREDRTGLLGRPLNG